VQQQLLAEFVAKVLSGCPHHFTVLCFIIINEQKIASALFAIGRNIAGNLLNAHIRADEKYVKIRVLYEILR
jgi:hypothetical protein